MSLFATVAIVCTMSECNNYHTDIDYSESGAIVNTRDAQRELDYAMTSESAMERFLHKYQIGETVFEIVSIDIETQPVADDEIP